LTRKGGRMEKGKMEQWKVEKWEVEVGEGGRNHPKEPFSV